MGKCPPGEAAIFPKNSKYFIKKSLKSTSNVLKDLPEAKTSESSQKFSKDQSYFFYYLPCPCKFAVQNYFLA